MPTLLIIADKFRVIVGLGEVVLKGDMQTAVTLVSQVAVGLFHHGRLSLETFAHLLGLGIDRRGQWVVGHLGIVAHVTDALHTGLQLLNHDTQLTIIYHAGSLIQVLMEQGNLGRIVGTATFHQFAATNNLHRLPISSHKGHQRLRHLAGSATYGIGLIGSRQVVHLQ